MLPILLIVAGLALGAPSALSETVADEASRNPDTLQAYVEQYYADTPVLADIAWCESRMRQFSKDGSVLRGVVDKDDIGVMQINMRFHKADAEKLGYDVHTLSGNLAYAKHLYAKQGTKPWFKSAPCWAKMASAAK